jgi:hypothetical protein
MSLFQDEFNNLTFRCSDGNWPPPNGMCASPGDYATGAQVISFYHMDNLSILACILTVCGIGIAAYVAGFFGLRSKSNAKTIISI